MGMFCSAPRWLKDALEAVCRGVVIDLGCGHGRSTELISRGCPGSLVIGIDLDCPRVSDARKRLEESASIGLVCGDASELPFRSSSIGSAVALLTLHEVDSDRVELLLREVHRVLREKGLFLVVVKVLTEFRSPAEELTVLTEVAYHKARELAYGEKAWGVRRSRELMETVEKAGFKTLKQEEVYAGRHIPPEEFLRSWGRDTLRILNTLSPGWEREELEQLVKRIKATAARHGYGPARFLVALFAKR